MNNNNLLLDFEPLSFSLEPEQIVQAAEKSSQVPNQDKQWKNYLNLLALFSFEQWLDEYHPPITLNTELCTALQPQYANLIEGACRLQVGEFKLCLITTGVMMDDHITLERAVIDLPDYRAHFYVVIAVEEEEEQVTIEGFITYAKLQEYQQVTPLSPQANWTYRVPFNWFDTDLEHLLLYLQCLEPTALALPTTPSIAVFSIGRMQAKLTETFPQLSDPNCHLWQLLTWKEGAPLLSNPELIDWFYRLQRSHSLSTADQRSFMDQLSQILEPLTSSVVNATMLVQERLNNVVQSLPQRLEPLTTSVINVGLWLRDELDQVSRNLSWTLLPNLASASLRSATTFEGIINALKEKGMSIPDTAPRAYQNLKLGNEDLRIYAVPWLLSPQETETEWTLLLILARQLDLTLPEELDKTLPEGLKFKVSDQTQVLEELQVNGNAPERYLYICVEGALGEEFSVTITLETGETLTLPPFSFPIESVS